MKARKLGLVAVDRILAAALTIASIGTSLSRHNEWFVLIAGVTVTASVAWRRFAPRPTTAVAIVGISAYALASGNPHLTTEPAAVGLNFYMLGRRSGEHPDSRLDWLFLGLAAGAISVDPAVPSPIDVVITWSLFAGGPFAAGRVVGTRSALTAELRANADRLAREQQARAERAAAEERNRIARELHDIVAHSVSVMVIQAQAARRIAPDDPDAARAALRSVQRCGRDALVEMRRMIGVLRHDPTDLLGAATPGMSELRGLVDRAAASGLGVELVIEGSSRELPADLDLLVYRIVQEALTNAIKHAGAASAQVRVKFADHDLGLEVTDTGRGPADATPSTGGHGLIGMRERLALYGGELHAGEAPGGGFTITARIPLDAKVAA